jgi:hypothetical protein
MAYRRRTNKMRTRRNRKQRTQKRRQKRMQRKSQKRTRHLQKTMKGGVDTPLFGDESIIQETDTDTETHVLDDSDITPPFETNDTDYGETTTESVSNDSSLGFGGKKMQRRKKSRTQKSQRAGGFTMTEEVNPRSYEDDYEKNLANIEEVILTS